MDDRTLNLLKIGDTVRVTRINGEGPIRRRIMEMGITRGCTVRIKRFAPLGDPVEIEVRGYSLGIRKKDAKMICVSENIAEDSG